MINKLNFDKKKEIFKLYSLDEKDSLEFNNLSQVNIFVGANNSGKSLFLRELLRFFSDVNLSRHFNDFYTKKELKYSVFRIEKTFVLEKLKKLEGVLIDRVDLRYLFEGILHQIKTKSDFLDERDILDLFFSKEVFVLNEFDLIRREIFENIENLYSLGDKSLNLLYVPIFRTIRKFGNIEYGNKGIGFTSPKTKKRYQKEKPINLEYSDVDYFKNRVIFDYFKEISYDYKAEERFNFIFTGEKINKSIFEKKNSYSGDRKLISKFENFLRNTFFNSLNIELTIIEDELFIKIGNEKERPIYELGDGIQSIIILLFPVFMNKDKDFYYFVEEPELNLHPGMQRVFIETLKQFPKTQVFITTHSNHFLDMSMENDNISIYSFQKDKIDNTKGDEQDASFKITTLNKPNESILNQLGVRNSSVFLSNCTIWVEGITDRFYIKKFLELYIRDEKKKNYLEDIHYSYVEYAGSNITHWNFDEENKTNQIFAKSISNKIFLIADSDVDEKGNPSEAKKERFERLGNELNNNFSLLECKEIENILSPKTIGGVVADYEKKDSDEIRIKNIDKINEEPFIFQNLGEFIDDNLQSKKRKTYASNNTISDKTGFCNRAIKVMNKDDFTYSDLSKEAKGLCEKVYKFIKKNNIK